MEPILAIGWDIIVFGITLTILILVISVLWRLNKALGIYIGEHEPEEDEDEAEEEDTQ
jgi:hypothetical protein